MTPAERTAKIAELRAEADRLEREGKRNWPRDVKRGMLFQHSHGRTYFVHRIDGSQPEMIGISGTNIDVPSSGSLKWLQESSGDFTYLGHARDLLAIKAPDAPDAPEPTGAELVGKVCEFSDDGVKWIHGECEEFDAEDCTWTYLEKDGVWWRFARLRREDRP